MYTNSIYFIVFTILAVFFFWYWGLLCFRFLCTYVLCLICNYLWNDSILVLAWVGNLVYHIHLVNAFELSYLLSKCQTSVVFCSFVLLKRDSSMWMQLVFCMLENTSFCGGWHIETQYWNYSLKDEFYAQWQSVKPFRRIFLQFLWRYFKCFSHCLFLWPAWVEYSDFHQRKVFREFLQVDVPR